MNVVCNAAVYVATGIFMHNKNLAYRPEIDGLRAIAVLSVIFFHAGFNQFSGGYVGVDVFFVISGYLITTILIREQEKEGISIAQFYRRRARRILPVLFFVMLSTLPIAWFFLPPQELTSYFSSIAATATFSSNIYFWYESGYWDTATSLKPLIHTWSLAVEEQYYLVFPLLVMAVWRRGVKFFSLLVVLLSIASLLFSQVMLADHPMLSFYGLPSRAWELLAGSLAAVYLLRRSVPRLSSVVSQVLPFAGAVMIVYPIFTYTEQTPFPGVSAIFPVFGTLLVIISAGQDNYVGRVLGSKPFVLVGLLSYSAYLWHQPILAFFKVRSLEDLSIIDSTGAIALTLIFSVLSYRFIERPIRMGKSLFGKLPIASSLAVIVLFLGIAWWGYQGNGFPSRLDGVYSTKARASENKKASTFTYDTAPGSEKPVVLIVGDSYVHSWSVALTSLIDRSKYRVISISYLGCKFDDVGALVAKALEPKYERGCSEFNRYAADDAVLSKVEKILITSHRPLTYTSNLFRFDLFKELYRRTDADVYVFGNYFQMKRDQSCLVAMFVRKSDASVCRDFASFNGSESQEKLSGSISIPFTYIDIYKLYCPSGIGCAFEAEGVPFIIDWNHLTVTFATQLLRTIIEKDGGYISSIGLSDVFLVNNSSSSN